MKNQMVKPYLHAAAKTIKLPCGANFITAFPAVAMLSLGEGTHTRQPLF